MRGSLSRIESVLLAACAAALLAAWWAPPLHQHAHIHDFADQRLLWGIPCALDVLSNLPFALVGVLGLRFLGRLPAGALPPVQLRLSALFFAGLILTAAASAWYHLRPDDAGLAVDRLGMAVAFAGLLGLLVATQVSARAGSVLGATLMVAGPLAAWLCLRTGNVLPWALLQFGGMVLVVALAWRAPAGPGLRVAWGWVIAAYAVAKVVEVGDHAIFEATGGWLSGHTLKHLVAACAAWPVIAALRPMQNGTSEPAPSRPALHTRRV